MFISTLKNTYCNGNLTSKCSKKLLLLTFLLFIIIYLRGRSYKSVKITKWKSKFNSLLSATRF